MSRKRQRWAALLAASTALHLAAALAGARLLGGSAPSAFTEVELEPAPISLPAATERRPVVAADGRVAPSTTEEPGRRTPGRRPAARRQPESAAPAAQGLSLSMRGAGGSALDLRPSFRVLDRPAAAGRALAAHRPGRLEPTAAETKRRLDRMLGEDQAARDLHDGRVDPHLYAVERDSEGMFHPAWSLVEGDRARLGQVRTSVSSWLNAFGRDYLKRLREYNESGRQRGPRDDEQRGILENYNKMLRAAESGADALACLVCVSLGKGESAEPKLARSSGRRPFDKLAVEAVRKAARSRQAPADLKPVQACYKVEAKFFRVPPLPMVGCTFDESKPSLSCFYPTKKILRSSVKLVSVRPLGS